MENMSIFQDNFTPIFSLLFTLFNFHYTPLHIYTLEDLKWDEIPLKLTRVVLFTYRVNFVFTGSSKPVDKLEERLLLDK